MTDDEKLHDLVERVMDNIPDMPGLRVIDFCDDGVYLTVQPPKGNGEPVSLEEVVAELLERKVEVQDFDLLYHTIDQQSGIGVKIAELPEVPITDGAVKVLVSPDRLGASLTVYPPQGGAPATLEMAMAALAEAGVTYGIDTGRVQQAIDLADMSEKVQVAFGVAMENGKNAEIEYHFDIHGLEIKPNELANGRADFYNLNLIQNVITGQVLAVKKPATEGSDGMTVTGEVITSKPGKDKVIKAGKNTELLDNESTLIATANGHVVANNGKVGVLPVFEVNGDVDFNSGNIDFVGSVMVKGSVGEGFLVKASGDVEIGGSISGGSVECGGHLKVKNGINGQRGKGQVSVEGNIFVKFIENANVNCGGDVFVGEAIMHSHVNAKGSVVVGGRKGVLVGGLIRAGKEISAKIVGSNFATPTELEAGVNPELRQEYNQVMIQLKEAEENLDRTQKAMSLLKHMEKTQGLAQDKKIMLVKVSRSQFQLMASIQGLKERTQEMEQALEDSENGKIMVSGLIHSGVRITIGRSIMNVQDDIQYASLTREAGEIQIAPLR